MRRVGAFVTVLVLLLTGAWWMFLISPKNTEIADLEDEHNLAIDTEQLLRAQIGELEAIRRAEVEYVAALGHFDALIPERPLLDEFIEQVYQVANETGVELQDLTPSLPAALDESELREVAVTAQIEGEFFEVLGFLFGLNDVERLVRVDSVAVASFLDEGGETILNVGVGIKLFTLADVVPIPDESTVTPDESSSSDEGAVGGDVEAAVDAS